MHFSFLFVKIIYRNEGLYVLKKKKKEKQERSGTPWVDFLFLDGKEVGGSLLISNL